MKADGLRRKLEQEMDTADVSKLPPALLAMEQKTVQVVGGMDFIVIAAYQTTASRPHAFHKPISRTFHK